MSMFDGTSPQSQPRIEGMTFGDLAPLLDGTPAQMEIALLRLSQIARGDGELTRSQAEEGVRRATNIIDPFSDARSQHEGVRTQAVLALEAIGANGVAATISPAIRDRAFSALSLLPIARDNASLDGREPLIEESQDVRGLSERAATLFAPLAPEAHTAKAA